VDGASWMVGRAYDTPLVVDDDAMPVASAGVGGGWLLWRDWRRARTQAVAWSTGMLASSLIHAVRWSALSVFTSCSAWPRSSADKALQIASRCACSARSSGTVEGSTRGELASDMGSGEVDDGAGVGAACGVGVGAIDGAGLDRKSVV